MLEPVPTPHKHEARRPRRFARGSIAPVIAESAPEPFPMARTMTSWLLTTAGMIGATFTIHSDLPALARVGLGASAPLLIFLAFKNLTVLRTQEGITQ